MMMLLLPNIVIAGNRGKAYTISMQRKHRTSSGHNQGLDREGNRIPPRPFICTISESSGIQSDINKEDISSYEIWSESYEICIASYTSEDDFIYHIFSIPGAYEIRLISDDYVFVGYILTSDTQ